MSQVQGMQEDMESGSWLSRMAQQLSGVTVIIIIAGGVLTFLLLFIFAKRQIMRFALRSHRGPHTPIGTEATKTIRKEILRRIEAVPKIMYEPQALREETDAPDDGTKIRPSHFYRMKALDDTKSLEQSMVKRKLGKRQCFESLRSFFIFVFTPGVDPRIVHQFCDSYEAARFKPKPFGLDEYKVFRELLKQLEKSLGTLHPKMGSSIRSPGKSSGTSSGSNKSSVGVQLEDIDITQSGTAYVRRLTKEKRTKWAQQKHTKESDEEHCLTDTMTLHEISIIPAAKDQSTIL